MQIHIIQVHTDTYTQSSNCGEAVLSDLGINLDLYYWLVYNCQSNQYCLYHWSVRTIMYVQFHNIC